MKTFTVNEDLYDEIILKLNQRGITKSANLLIKIKEELAIPNTQIHDEPVPLRVVMEPTKEHNSDGRLTATQKEAIKVLKLGGNLSSIRWNDVVYCCTYLDGSCNSIDAQDVAVLLTKEIVQGIVQNIFFIKEYVLTDFGKTVTSL